MIIFTILVITIIIAAIAAVMFAGVFGGATLLVFGDIIVFALIVAGIIKLIFRNKT